MLLVLLFTHYADIVTWSEVLLVIFVIWCGYWCNSSDWYASLYYTV